MAKKSLSVVMIVKNESEMIGECLESVKWADEIIVCDSGSIDNTCQLAQKYGAKVYVDKEWPGFGKQRQLAQSYATCDYVFMIDADERVTPELKQSIQAVLLAPITDKVYSCDRRNFFLGKFLHYSGWYPDRIVRLYPREKYRYNDNLVHESVVSSSAKTIDPIQIVPLAGALVHLTCRDFFVFQYKQLKYAESWAEERYLQGKRCSIPGAFVHAFNAFFKTWLVRRGFLDGKRGLLLAFVNSQYTFNKYTALWALSGGRQKSSLADSTEQYSVD